MEQCPCLKIRNNHEVFLARVVLFGVLILSLGMGRGIGDEISISEALDQPDLSFSPTAPNSFTVITEDLDTLEPETHDGVDAVVFSENPYSDNLWIDDLIDGPVLLSFWWKSSNFGLHPGYFWLDPPDFYGGGELISLNNLRTNVWKREEMVICSQSTRLFWQLAGENVVLDELSIEPLNPSRESLLPGGGTRTDYGLDFSPTADAGLIYWSIGGDFTGVISPDPLVKRRSHFVVEVEGPAKLELDLAVLLDSGWAGTDESGFPAYESPTGTLSYTAYRLNSTMRRGDLTHPDRYHLTPPFSDSFGPSATRTDTFTVGPGRNCLVFNYEAKGVSDRGLVRAIRANPMGRKALLMEALDTDIELYTESPWVLTSPFEARDGTGAIKIEPSENPDDIEDLFGVVNGPGVLSFWWKLENEVEDPLAVRRCVLLAGGADDDVGIDGVPHNFDGLGTSREGRWYKMGPFNGNGPWNRGDWNQGSIVIRSEGEVPINFLIGGNGGQETLILDNMSFRPGLDPVNPRPDPQRSNLLKRIKKLEMKKKKAKRRGNRNLSRRLAQRIRRMRALL